MNLIWPYVAAGLNLTFALLASAHVVLTKRDPRGAIGWVGVIWLAPVLGVLLYVWLGINRIERRARSLRPGRNRFGSSAVLAPCPAEVLSQALTPGGAHLEQLVKLGDDVSQRVLLAGNRVAPLVNGDQAYPAMLEAIDQAARSVTLTTYIFRNDPMGQQFLEALRRAVLRKVEVRVLIDDVGARYSWRPIPRLLRQAGIPCEQFLPTLIPRRFRYSNLRIHRKILVVDGTIGFTGGINIDERNCLKRQLRHPIQDLHFRLAGPVVTQLHEVLRGEPWFATVEADGPVLARGIPDGPDEDFETLRLTLLGALACARTSVVIITPYFLPDMSLIAALNVTALRGVQVDIVLPAKNDLSLVQWASTPLLRQLLERGCRVWLSPPPFDHTKLMLVDGLWTLLGSGNWDPRSLRLNFEFNVECYDCVLATSLAELAQSKINQSRRLSLADVDGRSLPIKLRDGVAGLFSPYL
jgi:cardiolipin synthase A/B